MNTYLLASDYPVTTFTSKLNEQGLLLLDYLRQVRHPDLPTLVAIDTTTLVKDCFHQFTTFLLDIAPLDAWYDNFYQYTRDLLSWLNRPISHLDLIVRSIEFAAFVGGLGIDC